MEFGTALITSQTFMLAKQSFQLIRTFMCLKSLLGYKERIKSFSFSLKIRRDRLICTYVCRRILRMRLI